MAKFILSAFADEITPDFDGQLEALKKLNIPLLELRGVDGKSFTQLTDAEVSAVGGKLKKAGIGLSALGSPIGKIAVTDDFEAHKALLDRIMDIGDRLDCRRIRVFSFYRGEGQSDEAFAETACRMLGELLDKADARGFMLCHENEKDILGDTPQREKALLDRFGGRLRAVLDSGNFAFCRFDPAPAYGLLKDYIDYMHIKDADEDGVIVPPGKGKALLEETLRLLNADYPDRELVLTMEPHLMMFTGLSSLSKLDDIRHKYSFSTPFEAFETATSAVREMLARL